MLQARPPEIAILSHIGAPRNYVASVVNVSIDFLEISSARQGYTPFGGLLTEFCSPSSILWSRELKVKLELFA